MKPRTPCVFCSELRFNRLCPHYDTPQKRRNRAVELHLCFNCLRTGHAQSTCPRKKQCPNCGAGSHSTLLCLQKFRKRPMASQGRSARKVSADRRSVQPVQTRPLCNEVVLEKLEEVEPKTTSGPNNDENDAKALYLNEAMASESGVLLRTVTVRVFNPQDHSKCCDALVFLDTGSNKSFATQELIETLKLPGDDAKPLHVSTFGSSGFKTLNTTSHTIGIRLRDVTISNIKAYSVPYLTGKLHTAHLSSKDTQILASNSIHFQSKCLSQNCLLVSIIYFHFSVSLFAIRILRPCYQARRCHLWTRYNLPRTANRCLHPCDKFYYYLP